MSTRKIAKRLIGQRGVKLVRWIRHHPHVRTIHVDRISFKVKCARIVSHNFWNQYETEEWDPTFIKIYNRLLDKNHSYIDVGSWIGPTVLYGANLSKHCYAIEPDPVAFLELSENLELNPHIQDKVTLSNYCISNSIGTTRLFVPGGKEYSGTSVSSTLQSVGNQYWDVQTTTLQEIVKAFAITDCNFIKIDIEGAEFDLLSGISDYLEKQKPVLLVEFHPMLVEEPNKKLNSILEILSFYEFVYDKHFKRLQKEYFNMNMNKTFQLVLASTELNSV